MKPIILLLLNNKALRLDIKNQLEEHANVYAAVKLDEVVAEIKWTEIGAILLDMTDNDLDSFGMLGVINSTYPSVPVVLIVNDENGDLSQFQKSPGNMLLEDEPFAGNIAHLLLKAAEKRAAAGIDGESDETKISISLANQMTRLRENIRRIEDYAFGEVEKDIRSREVSLTTISRMERTNIGLEGFLQIAMEGEDD